MAQTTIDPGRHTSHVTLERLGKVEFRIDCNAAAQQEFNRAMALYHSFAWTPVIQSFTRSRKPIQAAGLRTGAALWQISITRSLGWRI